MSKKSTLSAQGDVTPATPLQAQLDPAKLGTMSEDEQLAALRAYAATPDSAAPTPTVGDDGLTPEEREQLARLKRMAAGDTEVQQIEKPVLADMEKVLATPVPKPSVGKVAMQGPEAKRKAAPVDITPSVKPMGSESAQATARIQQPLAGAPSAQVDATAPKDIRQRLEAGQVQQEKSEMAELEEFIKQPRASVFSLPDQQADSISASPQFDPKWQKLQADFAREAKQQFSPADIAARKAAGTWGPADDARMSRTILSHAQAKLEEREERMNRMAMIAGERGGVNELREWIDVNTTQLEGLTQQYQDRDPSPEEAIAYNNLLSQLQQKTAEYNRVVKPFADEQKEIQGMKAYLASRYQQADMSELSDPEYKEQLWMRFQADKRWEEAQADWRKRGLTLRVIDEYVRRPVTDEARRFGGNILAFGLRSLDRAGNAYNDATGQPRYYSPFAHAADEVSKSLDRIISGQPTTLAEKPLLNEELELNEGALPKFLRGATYMALLAGTGSTAAMVPTVIASSSEDYYKEGIRAGMTPMEADVFSVAMGSMEGAVEVLNPGPFINSGVRKDLARRAVKALQDGNGLSDAMMETGKYVIKQGGSEAGEEVIAGRGQELIKLASNMAAGTQFDVTPTMQQVAEEVTMGFVLGALMASGGIMSQRPVFKESMAWAVQNPDAVIEHINATIPDEAEKQRLLERFETYQKVYRGLPDDIAQDSKEEIAAAVVEKERLKKEQGNAVVDETVAAAMGNKYETAIAEQDAIIKAAAEREANRKKGTEETPAQTAEWSGAEVEPKAKQDGQDDQRDTADNVRAGRSGSDPIAPIPGGAGGAIQEALPNDLGPEGQGGVQQGDVPQGAGATADGTDTGASGGGVQPDARGGDGTGEVVPVETEAPAPKAPEGSGGQAAQGQGEVDAGDTNDGFKQRFDIAKNWTSPWDIKEGSQVVYDGRAGIIGKPNKQGVVSIAFDDGTSSSVNYHNARITLKSDIEAIGSMSDTDRAILDAAISRLKPWHNPMVRRDLDSDEARSRYDELSDFMNPAGAAERKYMNLSIPGETTIIDLSNGADGVWVKVTQNEKDFSVRLYDTDADRLVTAVRFPRTKFKEKDVVDYGRKLRGDGRPVQPPAGSYEDTDQQSPGSESSFASISDFNKANPDLADVDPADFDGMKVSQVRIKERIGDEGAIVEVVSDEGADDVYVAKASEAPVDEAEEEDVADDDTDQEPTLDAEVDSRDYDTKLMGGQAEKDRVAGERTIAGQKYKRQPSGVVEHQGSSGDVVFSDGVKVPFTYALVDAGSIQPSHINRRRNPLHFLPEAQPKSRTDKESQAAAQRIAAAPDLGQISASPNAYSGAPIINSRGEVIQGNNRSEAMRIHYQNGGTSYKEDLAKRAEEFGMTEEQVMEMDAPVLVRVLDVTDARAIELGNYDVKDLESGGVRAIDEVALSARLPYSVKSVITARLFGGDSTVTIKESIRSNYDFIAQAIDPYLNAAQRSSLYKGDKREPSVIGMNGLEKLVQQFMFDGAPPEFKDIFDNQIPHAAREGITRSASAIFSTPESASILQEIQNAVMAIYVFNNSGISDFNSWLAQPDMFADNARPSDTYTATEIEIARLLNDEGTIKTVAGRIREYASLTAPTEGDMFTDASDGLSRQQAAEKVFGIKQQQDEKGATPQGGKRASAPSGKGKGRSKSKPKSSDQAPAEPKRSSLSTDDQERKARLREEIRKGFGQLNAGIDPQQMARLVEYGSLLVKEGVLDFAAWAKEVYETFGTDVAEYLKPVYNSVRSQSPQGVKMTPLREVRSADIQTITNSTTDGKAEQEPTGDRPGAPDDGTAGGGGASGRPPLRIVDEGRIPQPRSIVDASTYGLSKSFVLDEQQILGVNLALTAFEDGAPGFLLADGTGVGKTAQILAVADQHQKRTGKPSLIITQNKQIIEGSFANDSKQMGISGIAMRTYDDVRSGKIPSGKYGLVIFDEAHNLKNDDSQKSIAAAGIDADARMYATATPMDRPTSAAYFLAEITGRKEQDVARELGYVVAYENDPRTGSQVRKVYPAEGTTWTQVINNMLRLRGEAIASGRMIRREYPFYGKINMQPVSLGADFMQQQADIDDYWQDRIADARTPAAKRNLAGQRIGELSRFTESAKVEPILKAVLDDLAAGRAPIVVAEGVNPTTIKGLSDQTVPGLIQELDRRLTAMGVKVARVYGTGSKSDAVQAFQGGQAQVVLATPKSGGTGVNLDDTVGDRPRTLHLATMNFSGDQLDQILGRVSRRNTASPADIRMWFSGDAMSDVRRKQIADKKLTVLRRIQAGEDPDAVGFESQQQQDSGDQGVKAPRFKKFYPSRKGLNMFESSDGKWNLLAILKDKAFTWAAFHDGKQVVEGRSSADFKGLLEEVNKLVEEKVREGAVGDRPSLRPQMAPQANQEEQRRRVIQPALDQLRRSFPGIDVVFDQAEFDRVYGASGGNAVLQAIEEDAQSLVDGWYSRLEEGVSAKGMTQPASEWLNWMAARSKDGSFSMEEAKWTGLSDWLAGKGKEKLTKEQVLEFLSENRVRVEVIVKSDRDIDMEDEIMTWQEKEGGGTKFSQYQLPGGTNYREVLVTLPKRNTGGADWNVMVNGKMIGRFPSKSEANHVARQVGGVVERGTDVTFGDNYFSGHFDEPNVLFHLRVNDRVIPVTDEQRGPRERLEKERDSLKPRIVELLQIMKKESDPRDERIRQEVLQELKEGKISGMFDARRIIGERQAAADVDTEATIEWRALNDKWSDYNRQISELQKPKPTRVLFIEEIQSDWAQKGRKEGFGSQNRPPTQEELAEAAEAAGPDWDGTAIAGGVPSAPFVTDTSAWVELAIKQAVRMAVEGGYDRVAWTTGEQQNERYDLSKQVEEVRWLRNADSGRRNVTIDPIAGDPISVYVGDNGVISDSEGIDANGKRLDEVVGKEIADRIMAEESGNLSGDGLKIGGTGMKGFYDKIVPTVAAKVIKKMGGGKVGETSIEVSSRVDKTGSDGRITLNAEGASTMSVQPSFDITDAMRGAVRRGIPLMQAPAQNRLQAIHNLSAENLLYADQFGGLPFPSVGVLKEGMAYEEFGDITLVGTAGLADPKKGNKVWPGDAYTVRHPIAKYKPLSRDAFKRFMQRFGLDGIPAELIDDVFNSELESMLGRSWVDRDRVLSRIKDSEAVRLAFLKTQGKEVKRMPMKALGPKSRGSLASTNAFKKFYNANPVSWFDYNDAGYLKKLTDAYLLAVDEDLKRHDSETAGILRKTYLNKIGEDGLISFAAADRLISDSREKDRSVIDRYELNKRLREMMKPRIKQAFDDWVSGIVDEAIGDPYLVKDNGRGVPYTLDSVTSFMGRNRQAGAEGSLTFGSGKAVSMMLSQIPSLKKLREEAHRSIASKEEVRNRVEEIESIGNKYRDGVSQAHPGGNMFDVLDSSMEAIVHWFKSGRVNSDQASQTAAFRKALDRAGLFGDRVDDETISAGIEYANALVRAPRQYFESTPQRAVSLTEFKAAIVPKDVSKRVLDVLAKNGIKAYKYDPRVPYDMRLEERQRVLRKVNEEIPEALFQSDAGNPLGFFYNGKVYINPSAARSDTPFHEFGHVWLQVAKYGNKPLYDLGISLAKSSPYFDRVKSNPSYSHLNEEQMADEALAQAIGEKGADLFGEKRSKFRRWLNDLWIFIQDTFAKLGINLNNINPNRATFESFTNAVARDMASGRPVTTVTSDMLVRLTDPKYAAGDVFIQGTIQPGSALASKRAPSFIMWMDRMFTQKRGEPVTWKNVTDLKGKLNVAAREADLVAKDIRAVVAKESGGSAEKATQIAKSIHDYVSGKSEGRDLSADAISVAERARLRIRDLGKELMAAGYVTEYEAGLSENLTLYLRNNWDAVQRFEGWVTKQERITRKRQEQIAGMDKATLAATYIGNVDRLRDMKYAVLLRKQHDLKKMLAAIKEAQRISIAPELETRLRKLGYILDNALPKVQKQNKQEDKEMNKLLAEIEDLQKSITEEQSKDRQFTEEEIDLLDQIEAAHEAMKSQGEVDVYSLSTAQLVRLVQSQESSLAKMQKSLRRSVLQDLTPVSVTYDVVDATQGTINLTVEHANGDRTSFDAVPFPAVSKLFGDKLANVMLAGKVGKEPVTAPGPLMNSRLYERMMANEGKYVHRSYRAFHDPDWKNRFEAALGPSRMAEVRKFVGRELGSQKVAAIDIQASGPGFVVEFINPAGIRNVEPVSKSRLNEWRRSEGGPMDDRYVDIILARGKARQFGVFALPAATKPVPHHYANFQPGASAQIDQFISEVVDRDGTRRFFQGMRVGQVETSIFKRKGDVPEEMLALLGEVTDGRVSIAETILRIRTAIAQREMHARILSESMGRTLSETKTNMHTVPLTKAQMPILGERTIWATPEAAEIIAPARGASDDAIWAAVATLSMTTKMLLTVFKPGSSNRNFLSSLPLLFLTGNFNVKDYRYSLSVLSQGFTKAQDRASALTFTMYLLRAFAGKNFGHAGNGGEGKYSKQEMRKQYLRFQELFGDDGATSGLIKDLYERAMPLLRRGAGSLMRKPIDTFAAPYAMSDSVPKFLVWLGEQRLLREAYPEKSQAEIEELAAVRAKRMTPTYSENPEVINKISRSPIVGPFVNWNYAIWKNLVDIYRVIGEDFISGNKTLKKAAIRRAAISTLARTGVFAVASLISTFWGWDEEEEEAVATILPEYEENNVRIFISKDPKHPRYFDLTYMDPSSQMFAPINAFSLSMQRGEGASRSSMDGLSELFSQYYSEEIFLKALVAAMAGYDKDRDQKLYGMERFGPLAKSLTPGVVQEANQIVKGFAGADIYSGDRVVGQYDWRQELANAAVGTKLRERDMASLGERHVRGALGQMQETRSRYKRAMRDAAKEGLTKQEAADIYPEFANEWNEQFDRMSAVVDALKSLGFSDREIYGAENGFLVDKKSILLRAGMSQEMLRALYSGNQVQMGSGEEDSIDTGVPKLYKSAKAAARAGARKAMREQEVLWPK